MPAASDTCARWSRLKTVPDAELTLLKKFEEVKGGPPPFDPKKPRGPYLRHDALPRVAGRVCAGRSGDLRVPETARVDDTKVRALLTERRLIKDKRAMPFVQLFKVRCRKQKPSSSSPYVCFF